ncbi:putative amidase [Lachnellula suecica]|uniref:Putative amidase n=1 Tax=Lachnellula suecica TaxID=602035 RepID=A0A8T9C8V1_9HELO|nr:putative amidase [Lachnellula suecica]
MGFSLKFLYRLLCFPMRTTSYPPLDLLKATGHDCQVQLSTGKLTSVQLVDLYLKQIKSSNGYLRAVLEVAPGALREAEALDDERRRGIVRGPFHGVPILIKDNVNTHAALGMNTTGGSLAFVGSRPKQNAAIVDRIIAAGMIILGKSQLSEFAGSKSHIVLPLNGLRGSDIYSGWSAVGGQAQSAYTTGDIDFEDKTMGHSSPSGSSTGSAVGVSAGYCPCAIGTDTFGSLITPSTRAALYSIRPTMDLVPREGILPTSQFFDTAGPMAKSSEDLAHLLDILVLPHDIHGKGSYAESLIGGFEDLNIGVLKPEEWYLGPSIQKVVPSATSQITADTYSAYAKIKRHAKSFQEVSLISPGELMVNGSHSIFDLIAAGFKENIENYISTLETPRVGNLQDIIQFNKDHAELELPRDYNNQDQLVRAQNIDMPQEERKRLFDHARTIGRELGIDKTLNDYGVDVIIAPADSAFNLLVSAAGYPSATMPLSYLDYNGRPIGLAVFSTAHKEKLLLKVLSAWEKISEPRRPPLSLV